MNLKYKFVLWCGVLTAGTLVLGGVSAWHLWDLRRSAQAVAAEYDAMDRAEALAAPSGPVVWLRDSLRGPQGAAYRDEKHFTAIRAEAQLIVRQLRRSATLEDGDGVAELDLGQSALDHLDAAGRQPASEAATPPAAGPQVGNAASRPPGKPPDPSAAAAADELDKVRDALRGVAKQVPASARRHAAGAADRLYTRFLWTLVVLFVVLGASTATHIKQYRALVRPLLLLRDNMRRSAANEYRDAVRPVGDREFRDVAAFFNGLAKELAELYRGLEQKVIARTRELVRSERLASVGFLAAGVAHEINNPLSVISGYAELAGKGLRRVLTGDGAGVGAEADAEAEAEALAGALDAQAIIRDEAFRCKEITGRLLSLARGGGTGREPLCMDEMARQVTVLTKGLKNYRDRRVLVEFKQDEPLEVLANPTEMKQVLLNLTVNALEAVPPDRGEVRIGGRRAGEWVEVSVEDNGKGMTAETLEQVFEPFFTAKRGAGEPGTGLGLSITHAIVENHGGRIRAESGGPGKGSRFTVRLPARPAPGRTAAGVEAAVFRA